MFFVMNILIVATGVVLIRQKSLERVAELSAEADAQKYKSATDYALAAQERIMADKVAKTNSIANNPDTVQREVGVTVNRAIPAVTKTVTVTESTAASTAKATTKKS